jgi:hypothetical protein
MKIDVYLLKNQLFHQQEINSVRQLKNKWCNYPKINLWSSRK